MHKENIDAYLMWVEANKDDLIAFKEFTEAHRTELEELGKNPVVMRDIVVILLEDIEQNEANFARYNQIWDRYN